MHCRGSLAENGDLLLLERITETTNVAQKEKEKLSFGDNSASKDPPHCWLHRDRATRLVSRHHCNTHAIMTRGTCTHTSCTLEAVSANFFLFKEIATTSLKSVLGFWHITCSSLPPPSPSSDRGSNNGMTLKRGRGSFESGESNPDVT